MAPKLAEYIEAGQAFDADERLEAAHQLLLSVDRDDDTHQTGIDDAWQGVIQRRVREVVEGTAELVDGPAAHAHIRAEIAARRK